MPVKRRIKRQVTVRTALEILRKSGIEGVNAQNIANLLNCSTQPIYHESAGMEELKKSLFMRQSCCTMKKYAFVRSKVNARRMWLTE